MALKTRLVRDSYINFTLFNMFPYVCSKCGATNFKQNAPRKRQPSEKLLIPQWQLNRTHKIPTNVTSAGKTRDFVHQGCFILTRERFPAGPGYKVSEAPHPGPGGYFPMQGVTHTFKRAVFPFCPSAASRDQLQTPPHLPWTQLCKTHNLRFLTPAFTDPFGPLKWRLSHYTVKHPGRTQPMTTLGPQEDQPGHERPAPSTFSLRKNK